MPRIARNTCFFFFVFCLLSFAASAQTKSSNVQTIEGKKFYIHKVEKGQSLYAISKLYAVTLEELYVLNPELKNGSKAGQEIKVPYAGATHTSAAGSNSTATQPDSSKYLTYRITKGETVYSITRKFNLSEKQLITYNPSLAEGLKEGQLIVVGEKGKRKHTLKEAKDNKQTAIPKENKSMPPPAAIDSSLLKPVSKPKKPAYNVALILPFKLEQSLNTDLSLLVKTGGNFPAVPALAVDFYLGFKRAVDSLVGQGFEINLQLYDVDEDSTKLIRLINDPRFKDFDFIFGPLYANGFKSIAKKAKELHIPIVSPITQQNKFLYNNMYISKTNPSQFTLLEGLADYCIDSLVKNNANMLLMAANDKDKKEMSFVSAFKKYYNERQRALGKPAKDTVRVVKGLAGLKTAYRPDVKNIVVSLSSNQVIIADFTTQLALFAVKKDIVLCGWENTSSNEHIDQEYLNQLGYTFPHQYNLLNTGSYGALMDGYRQLQETSPSDYYFMGFDIALYYLKNLKDSGPDFVHNLANLPLETNYMRFKFTRPDMLTGFDNRGMYIFKYNNYQLQKTGWK
jgi:LysM repeat protein/ABC-type branched-subunit amino acid transport system substrate-binding protein